jgi:hypothetical protein
MFEAMRGSTGCCSNQQQSSVSLLSSSGLEVALELGMTDPTISPSMFVNGLNLAAASLLVEYQAAGGAGLLGEEQRVVDVAGGTAKLCTKRARDPVVAVTSNRERFRGVAREQ